MRPCLIHALQPPASFPTVEALTDRCETFPPLSDGEPDGNTAMRREYHIFYHLAIISTPC